MNLSGLVTTEIVTVFILFSRIGAALMLVPAFGEIYVPARFRLLFALVASATLVPVLRTRLPSLPAAESGALLALAGGEAVRGLMIGGVVRAAMVAASLAGGLVAAQAGLSSATFFDPNDATQNTIGSSFLSLAALAMLFAVDGHHALLTTLAGTYDSLPAGATLPFEDMSEFLVRVLGRATEAGLRIAAPVVFVTLLLNAVVGALGRLVPSIQTLFLVTPVQLALGLGALMLSLAAGLQTFVQLFDGTLRTLAG